MGVGDGGKERGKERKGKGERVRGREREGKDSLEPNYPDEGE